MQEQNTLIDNYETINSLDLHCHIDLYDNPQSIIEISEKSKVLTLTVTTTPKAWPQNKIWTKNCKYIKPALGFHPQIVAERIQDMVYFKKYLSEAKFIGEIGLDKGPDYINSFTIQRTIFLEIMELCSKERNKIYSIHSYKAEDDILSILSSYSYANNKTILHWFTGNIRQTKKALDLNCYFSINIKMFDYYNSRKLTEYIPIDRILLESDGPFITYKGNKILPSDTIFVLKRLSESRKIDYQKLKEQIIKNSMEIQIPDNKLLIKI